MVWGQVLFQWSEALASPMNASHVSISGGRVVRLQAADDAQPLASSASSTTTTTLEQVPGSAYVADIESIDGRDGDIAVGVLGGVLDDVAGNANSASETLVVRLDTTRPKVRACPRGQRRRPVEKPHSRCSALRSEAPLDPPEPRSKVEVCST